MKRRTEIRPNIGPVSEGRLWDMLEMCTSLVKVDLGFSVSLDDGNVLKFHEESPMFHGNIDDKMKSDGSSSD